MRSTAQMWFMGALTGNIGYAPLYVYNQHLLENIQEILFASVQQSQR